MRTIFGVAQPLPEGRGSERARSIRHSRLDNERTGIGAVNILYVVSDMSFIEPLGIMFLSAIA